VGKIPPYVKRLFFLSVILSDLAKALAEKLKESAYSHILHNHERNSNTDAALVSTDYSAPESIGI